MTKTIVIGEVKETKKLTPIQFQRCLNNAGSIGASSAVEAASSTPRVYNYVELICKDYQLGCDLMFAYHNPSHREDGILYIGRWNDGIVE